MNNIRRRFICIIYHLLLLCLSMTSFAREAPEDSLRKLLLHTQDLQERVRIYNNLSDYCYNTGSENYPKVTYQLLSEAIKAKNEYGITEALRKLVMLVDRRDRVLTNDSIIRYIQLVESNLKGDWKRSFLTEIRLRHIRSTIEWTEDADKTIEEIMKQYTAPIKDHNDIYSRIEREYALGKISGYLLLNWKDNMLKGLRYYDNLMELLRKIPLKYRANLFFCVNEDMYTGYFNVNEKKRAAQMLEFMYNTLEQYREQDFVAANIYQNYDDIYALYYGGMARCPDIIGKTKAAACLEGVEKLSRKPGGRVLELYSTYKEFYSSLNDYPKAILYSDSILCAVRDSGFFEVQAVYADAYKEQAEWYAALKKYEHAYNLLLRYDGIKDSITNADARTVRQEINVRYDVDRLKLEKLQLESETRKYGLIFGAIILALTMAWGITQHVNLRKIQRVQKRLIESNEEVIRQSERAQESERMKTAFINSMCHEIRTPLNLINGFSDLLFDETIDHEAKKEFPQLIQQNTNQLTHLINDLLEMASLDSSSEEFNVELVDVRVLLEQAFDKLISHEKKESIEYKLDVQEGCIIPTHHIYLTRVISNILNNANNFTKRGSIILSCKQNETQKKLIISVTDTGIGIPEDKWEWIFERFTKIDEFKPGIGLGLHVCKLIMKRLNGTILIDPEYSGGTRINITLSM